MELELFLKRIQNTALLTAERKEYYVANAGKYPPGLRAKIVETLLEHEKSFIEAETEKEKEKVKQKLKIMLDREEVEHKKELLEAEKLLEELVNE